MTTTVITKTAKKEADMSTQSRAVEMSEKELLEIYDFAVWLGRAAGKMLLEGVEKRCGDAAGRDQKSVDKDSAVDIVTQTDLGGCSSCMSGI